MSKVTSRPHKAATVPHSDYAKFEKWLKRVFAVSAKRRTSKGSRTLWNRDHSMFAIVDDSGTPILLCSPLFYKALKQWKPE